MGLRDDPRWSHAKTVSDRLRWARQANGWSQDELIARAKLPRRDNKMAGHMGRGGYVKYENGQTDLPHEHAVILAKALSVRWEWLLNGEAPLLKEADEEPRPPSPLQRLTEALKDRSDEEQEAIVSAVETLVKRRA